MDFWVARNQNGDLSMFSKKPEKIQGWHHEYYWSTREEGESSMWLDNDLFPEVTFENSPQEVNLEAPNGSKSTISKKEREELFLGAVRNAYFVSTFRAVMNKEIGADLHDGEKFKYLCKYYKQTFKEE